MMNRARVMLPVICFCVFLASLSSAMAVAAGTIELAIPDTCASKGGSLWLPVYTTDVTDSGVYGYNLTIRYDSTFVEIDSATAEGTISEAWGTGVWWNVVEGEDSLRIAHAGVTPLTGAGILVRFKISILSSAPVDSSVPIDIPKAILRDDPAKPPILTHAGWLTIPCSAGIDYEKSDRGSLRMERIGPSKIRWYLDYEDVAAPELRIYDPQGRFVTALMPSLSREATSYVWKGRNHSGSKVAGGVYFYEVVAGERRWNGKVHILR